MAKLFRKDGPPAGEPATVSVTGSGLQASAGEAIVVLSYDGLRGRIGGYEDAWIIFENEAEPGVELWVEPAFVRDEMADKRDGFPPAFAEHFDELATSHASRTRTRSILRGGLLVAFVALLVWFFTGGLTDAALNAIPYSVEQSLGDMAAEEFAGQAPECSQDLLTGAVATILERLVEQMDEVNYEYRVRVLMSDDINAFALPGGEIFFYSGLLEEAESEHEVAAVMGHEINHAVMRHGLRGMVQSLGVRALFMLVVGDASEGLQVLGAYAGKLGTLKFGRDQEREADELGVALMARAGFDPDGAVTFFGKLAEATGDDGGQLARLSAMASTHPASTERQERLAAMAVGLKPATPRGLDTEWVKIRGLCSPGGD